MSRTSTTPLFDHEMGEQLRAALEDERAALARGDVGAADDAAARLADLREVLARHHGRHAPAALGA